jgi:tetratricopeptide (TPR) repeat protein
VINTLKKVINLVFIRLAIETCNKVLEFDPKSEKGLYRLASAYFGLSEYQDAIEHAKKLVEVNPENKDAVHLLALSKQKVVEYQKKEKSMYSKMFSGLASK